MKKFAILVKDSYGDLINIIIIIIITIIIIIIILSSSVVIRIVSKLGDLEPLGSCSGI